jgi:hypothetical protein
MKEFYNKFKPILFLVVLPIIAFFVFIFASVGATEKTPSQIEGSDLELSASTVKLDKTNFDFGTITQKDGLVNAVFDVTNMGDQDIFLTELYTSCGCTKAQLLYSDGTKSRLYSMKGMSNAQDFTIGKNLKPGETVKIKTIFDPNAHGPQGIGYIKRNIMLGTNLKDNPLIQVSFEATVTR